MTCVKCGQESPDGTSFCPSCGTRLIAREWTLSGTTIGLIAFCLLLLGAGATWLALTPHKVPPVPAPTAQTLPSAQKPPAGIAPDPAQAPTEVFKDFAPAKTSSFVNPAVQTALPHTSAKAHSPVPEMDERFVHAVTFPLGPVQNQIAAGTQISKGFTMPDNLAGAHFQTDVVRLDGSKRLHVWVVGNNRQILFDSGICTQSHINLDLTGGKYLLVIANSAFLRPVTVDIRGKITGRIP
jgi:hypothetical protein